MNRRNPPGAATWAALSLAFLCGGAEAAEPPPPAVPQLQENAPAELSVESLAELARPSVVTVSHLRRDGETAGVGSGFVVSPDGLIATSLHVIGEARRVEVRLLDGRRFEATAVHAWDRKLDLAIVRITASGLVPLVLGDSDELKQGASVVAVGNPLGLKHSIVQGVISARREFENIALLQLAIPIEQGNSGGPLLDRQGRVHGILNMKSALTANLGFATPVNALKPLLDRPNTVPIDRWLALSGLNPRQWTTLFGARWTRKGGSIHVEEPGAGFGGRSLCLSKSPPPELPFEIGVTVRLDDEAGAAGLAFGADGEHRHYGFYPTAGQMRLTRFEGPDVYSWTILEQGSSPAYRPGEWNRIKVRIEPDRLICYVNGKIVFESGDHVFRDGAIGLAKFRQTRASFKDFESGVTVAGDLPGPSEAIVAKLQQELKKSPAPAALEAALRQHPYESRGVLLDEAAALEERAGQLRKLAGRLPRQAVQEELVELMKRPEGEIDLFRATLLLSKLENPELDVSSYEQQLAEMAREIAQSISESADAASKLRAVRDYLFLENGFHGSRSDYYNRSNSYINEVLDNREGLPITLSVLFMELARRVGLAHVAGAPVPGHFMVRYDSPDGTMEFIDVFDGGKSLSREAVEQRMLEQSGSPLRDAHIAPASKKEILLRMVRNLIGARQQDRASALPCVDLLADLLPEDSEARLNRAILRAQDGDKRGAKLDLQWLLDHPPPRMDLDRVSDFLRSLE